MQLLRRLLDILTAPLRALMSAPGRMVSGSRRAMGLSLPARVAILTAVFLLLCIVISIVVYLRTPGRPIIWSRVDLTFIIVVTVLAVAIPIVLYKALKLWLEGDVSAFPDIDRAWKAGLAELERHGLDLQEVPLFVVVGSADEDHEKALFGASRLNFNVREFPPGPEAVHWYANPDGVWLVCSGTSCLSRLARLGKRAAADQVQAEPVAAPSRDALRGTIVAGGGGPSPSPAARRPAAGASPPAGVPAADIRGTMIVSSAVTEDADSGAAASPSAGFQAVRLEQPETVLQQRRLEHLCRLIRRARQPLCPINGLLTMLPYGLVQRSAPEAVQVQRAVRSDLETISRTLKIRCPVTALVTGMEREPGFQELVRRVGRDRAASQRFGKGFSVDSPATPERLEALAAHACGAFEDWVYALFRERDALSRPGNTRLYALLCQIRRNVQSRLADILALGYGSETEAKGSAPALLMGGCYFAATGDSDDRQAFVRAVLDKLPEQQEQLEWDATAYREDEKHQVLAQFVMVADTLLLLGLGALVLHKWFPFWR